MSRAAPLRKQGGTSDDIFRSQSNIESAYGGLSKNVLLDGVLLEDITIGLTETNVAHKLGRDYRGYILCSNNSFSSIKTVSSTNKDKFINLQATVNCVVTLWIF